MSFFDDKNEVINIELTPYGKHLLSKGKFKPHSYAFFDDDIVYDSQFIGIEEEQNDIQERILNNTPVIKPQRAYTSAEESAKINDLLAYNNVGLLKVLEQQLNSDKNYALSLPLGKSSFSSEYYPAWQIKTLKGAIKSNNEYIDNGNGFSGSLQPYLKIPQLNLLDTEYNVKIIKNNLPEAELPFFAAEIATQDNVYYVTYKDDYILLEVNEENVQDLIKNFDIEVYVEEEKEVFGKETKQKYWKQLNFLKQPEYIKNKILLDESVNPDTSLVEIDKEPTLVEHYFVLLVDDEITLPPQEIAKYNLYGNIYGSNVTPQDPSGENC